MKDCTETKLSEVEKKEISDRAKAFSEEEIIIILRNIPGNFMFDELKRRDEIKDKILSEVKAALKGEI